VIAAIGTLLRKIIKSQDLAPDTEREFRRAFKRNLKTCNWEPHPRYSVFTQYDQEYYLRRKDAFLHKYRCFYAVSQTIRPKKIIEMGTAAGSSADAYLSAAPTASYVGFDSFGKDLHRTNQTVWDPYEIATKLFASRGFNSYELIKIDLRTLSQLPCQGDFVVVDAGHDFENEYADLKLALTADPLFIFVDDTKGSDGVQLAIKRFLSEDVHDQVDYTVQIDYLNGGLVIKLKK
jgi:hypothetical protein